MKLGFKVLLVLVLVFGLGVGGAFAGGVTVGKNQEKSSTPVAGQSRQFFQGTPVPGQGGRFFQGTPVPGQQGDGQDMGGLFGAMGRGATGTVEKVEGDTITLTTPQGSVVVNLGGDTAIQKMVTGSRNDIKKGDRILVSGEKNDDTINATAISILGSQ
ncbi:MAG: hypothetical protein HY664_01215 [Chloroflexi bacterium]|nr:hypothetical protein [Chloroflexota bacterium]